MVGIGYGLLVLFFAIGIFQSAASFRDFQRPEFALRHFIRFILAKLAVGSCMELMTAIFDICAGIISTVMGGVEPPSPSPPPCPRRSSRPLTAWAFAQHPLWLVAFLGSLVITVLSFVLLLTIYGRFFPPISLHRSGAPSPGLLCREGTAASGKQFVKSYIGVCMEGAVVVLACVIYSAFLSSSTPAADASLGAVAMVWQYIGQMVFNMLILTGLVRGSDRIVKEMFGL